MAKRKKAYVCKAQKGGAPKAGHVWQMSAEEATLARMPKYNGYACGTGAHGDAKYNRAKQKRAWQKDFSQEGTRSCGFLPLWDAMDGRPFDYVLLPLRWHQGTLQVASQAMSVLSASLSWCHSTVLRPMPSHLDMYGENPYDRQYKKVGRLRKEHIMATVVENRSARMDLRLEEARKARYERAAGLKGQTLTQWSLQHLDDAASRDIEEARTLSLDNESFDAFCALLEAPMPDATRRLIEQEPIWA